MKEALKKHLLIGLGWGFVLLAAIGIIVPLLPTTPFLILALAVFARCSPRFHQMLLNHAWFGPTLRQWEAEKTMPRSAKYKATALIIATFGLSLFLMSSGVWLSLFLVGLALILLIYIWKIKETRINTHE